jgi:hypothetical protein
VILGFLWLAGETARGVAGGEGEPPSPH